VRDQEAVNFIINRVPVVESFDIRKNLFINHFLTGKVFIVLNIKALAVFCDDRHTDIDDDPCVFVFNFNTGTAYFMRTAVDY